MAVLDILKQIDDLKYKIDSFGKLDDEILKRVNYKFRLDWNYHSNAMEGNSLTRQETRTVMVGVAVISGKPVKDIIEMQGHDAVITEMLKIGRGDARISEKRIKDIHRAIVHEDNPEEKAKIGQWKTLNNYLLNYRGERYDFAPFGEVPEKMHELLNWVNAEIDKIKNGHGDSMHPAILAFEFHYRYVTIHPFHDGNGRTGRILANLILISFGFPPIIIKLNEKDNYGKYLSDIQSYGGDSDLYYEFMGERLIQSENLVLKAINGESIEEPDDLDKKLLLLEKELEAIGPEESVRDRFSGTVFLKIYDEWLSDVLRQLIPVMQKFNKFFTGTSHHIFMSPISSPSFANEPADEIITKFRAECERNVSNFRDSVNFNFYLHYGTLIKGGLNTFGCNYGFQIRFEHIKYKVTVDEFSETNEGKTLEFKEKLLHQPPTKGEIDLLIKTLSDTVYTHIDYNTKKSGIR